MRQQICCQTTTLAFSMSNVLLQHEASGAPTPDDGQFVPCLYCNMWERISIHFVAYSTTSRIYARLLTSNFKKLSPPLDHRRPPFGPETDPRSGAGASLPRYVPASCQYHEPHLQLNVEALTIFNHSRPFRLQNNANFVAISQNMKAPRTPMYKFFSAASVPAKTMEVPVQLPSSRDHAVRTCSGISPTGPRRRFSQLCFYPGPPLVIPLSCSAWNSDIPS
jgi:hypothetical protein